MTQNELIKLISDDITISGRLPKNLPDEEYKRIIFLARKFFLDENQYSVQKVNYVILSEQFNNPQFRNSRQLILPDTVVSVVKFQEINGIGRLGNIDRDFAEDRLVASEIFTSAFHGDDLVMRTAQYSYFDLARAFFLEQIAYDYNKNSHILRVEGRDPKFDVFIETWSAIDDSKLYEDYLFIKYCTANAKMSFGRLVNTYDWQLPGAAKINGDMYLSQGETELAEVKEKIASTDCADWFLIYH